MKNFLIKTKAIERLLSIAFWVGGLFLLSTFIKFVFFYFAPTSYWIEYYSVTSTLNPVEIGVDLYISSDRIVRRDVFVDWNDILYCDIDNDDLGYVYYSNLRTSRLARAYDPNGGGWRWSAGKPVIPSTCYVEAGITATVPFNIKKTQRIKSPLFRIE